ncbi:MAG: type II secretion system F family protein [Candidatus Omnitrophica bacterium]|nr:type II secretion system F family protein [Candidatus Omnitrophota bacterium]
MTKFFYKAKSGPTKIVDGFIEEQTKSGAIREIVAMGLTPLDVVPAAQRPIPACAQSKSAHAVLKNFHFPFSASRSVSARDIVFFTRQLSDLVEASVPLLRVIQIASRQTRQPYFKSIIEQMHLFVQNGGSLSGAMAQYPAVFPAHYVNMVKTGEVGGQLDKVLRRLADHLEKEYETRGKIRSSLAYPAFVLGVGILTVFVLLTFVIPRLSVMFEDLDQALPLPTLVLMHLSGFFARYWWLLIGIFVIIKIYWDQWTCSVQGRLWLDGSLLKIPFWGEFIRDAEIGRFARTLGTLLESGVPLTTALNAIHPTIDNLIMRDGIKKVSKAVTEGQALKSALGQCPFFPEMVIDMVDVGEESGRLEKGLYKIAETLERQTDQTVKVLMSLLGPAVLMVIVSLVGFAVIAMLLPIFRMNLLIQ